MILMIVGFYNGYPLVHSDTGTYIYSGFSKIVPNDRPIAYGLFIRVFSAGISLWYVIFIQNVITSFVVYETMLNFVPGERKKINYCFLAVISLLTFFTGIGWCSNQIMPDLFAPVMVLSLMLLLFSPALTRIKKCILSIILCVSMIVHLSHMLIPFVLIASYLLVGFIMYRKGWIHTLHLKNVLYITGILAVSWLVLPSIHALFGGGFTVSRSTHVFLVAHLIDKGILKEYLDEHGDNTYRLYQYRDSLPAESAAFLWEPDSPLYKTGGWEDSREEYWKIIRGTLTRPGYLVRNIRKSVIYTFSQLVMNDIGQGLSAYPEGSPPYGVINWRFPDEFNAYLNSKQNKWNGADLNLKTLNVFHLLLLIASFCAVVYLFFTESGRRIVRPDLQFLIFIFLALISNAMITAGLNIPLNRYQSRIVWLLPFILAVIVIRNADIIKDHFNRHSEKEISIPNRP